MSSLSQFVATTATLRGVVGWTNPGSGDTSHSDWEDGVHIRPAKKLGNDPRLGTRCFKLQYTQRRSKATVAPKKNQATKEGWERPANP
ncbi:hypothetical protein QCA50_002306 [Cerrena zonata]|uniref:Uncharacterized protein n=1 Tax=Cerrena zonata TaxID=2478898 RepID=A0AAW0GYY2_9APHY